MIDAKERKRDSKEAAITAGRNSKAIERASEITNWTSETIDRASEAWGKAAETDGRPSYQVREMETGKKKY